jgi:CHAD domain-containing protein
VLVAVADQLHERYPGQLPATAFTALREALSAADGAASRSAGGEAPLTVALGHLEEAIDDLQSWPLDRATWKTVLDGLTRSYARGRQTYRAMGPDASFEARHEWRKRVKDLWYQQRLVAEAWPPVIDAEAEEAHLLSELLGDDHDHAVLHEAITGGRVDPGPEAAELLALVDRRREELFHDALLLGRRVYAETPKAFRKRHAAYLSAWADAHRAAPGPG